VVRRSNPLNEWQEIASACCAQTRAMLRNEAGPQTCLHDRLHSIFYSYKGSIKRGSFLKENQTKKYDFQTFLFLKDLGVAPVTRLK
jgi:hypothetical protein